MIRACLVASIAAASVSASSEKIVLGSGDYTYEYVPDLLRLPADAPPMLNGHGLAKDHAGNIYFTYELNMTSDAEKKKSHCLVKFTPDGTDGTMLGDTALSAGTPHGLRITTDGTTLWHVNNDGHVRATDLEGHIQWERAGPPAGYEGVPFKPTDAIKDPAHDVLYLSDGYGSSYIHMLQASTGEYLNLTFGGGGDAKQADFSCPHNVNIDPRDIEPWAGGRLIVSDRSNARLMYYTMNGGALPTFSAEVDLSATPLLQPDSTDFGAGGEVLIPSLNGPAGSPGGGLGILDHENQLVSFLNVSGSPLGTRGFVHPHDAIFLANGDIALCHWNPGRLSYWRRVPAQE